jgi:hypothetical protein
MQFANSTLVTWFAIGQARRVFSRVWSLRKPLSHHHLEQFSKFIAGLVRYIRQIRIAWNKR